MANPYHHALSSVKRWGGRVEDYLAIHEWFDASKEMGQDFRHRALRHHSQGIYEAQRVFGTTIPVEVVVSDATDGVRITRTKQIPVRWIGEQHVTEDLGFIPTLWSWLGAIEPQPWMNRGARALSRDPDLQAIEQRGGAA